MKAELLTTMGSDLTVVNSARVSFDKHVDEFRDQDEKLLKYLASHGHWTPFAHPQLQFRISAPIFVARQLVKHQIGLVWNEVSRRYVDTVPRFFIPEKWRERPKNKKQGSGTEVIDLTNEEDEAILKLHKDALDLYSKLLLKNVAPEQARMLLPQSMYTEWYWTGSLFAFSRVYGLRTTEDAQMETRELVESMGSQIHAHFPISWKYLTSS